MTTNTLKIERENFTAINCTAYIPTIGETEADRRDMMLVDMNENVDTDETNYVLVPEYFEDGEEIDEFDPYWSTDADDLGTAIVDGEYFDIHAPHTDDERDHDDTQAVRASVSSYGGQASFSGRRGDEAVDVLDVTIPGDAFFHSTEHRLLAEAVIDDAEAYDESASYAALCEMVADVMKTLACRLVKPVIIPLSDFCGGEDIIVEPTKPYDDEDHTFDDSKIVDGVKIETI